MQLDKIQVRHFRSWVDLALDELARINVFYGTSDTGKSGVIDALLATLTGTCRGCPVGRNIASLRSASRAGTRARNSWSGIAWMHDGDQGVCVRRTEDHGARSETQEDILSSIGASADVVRACLWPGWLVANAGQPRRRALLSIREPSVDARAYAAAIAAIGLADFGLGSVSLSRLEQFHAAALEALSGSRGPDVSRLLADLCDATAPSGPLRSALSCGSSRFSASLDRHAATLGWSIDARGWLEDCRSLTPVLVDGIAEGALSWSRSACLSLALSLALAESTGFGVVGVDRWESIQGESRERALALIESTAAQVFMCSTVRGGKGVASGGSMRSFRVSRGPDGWSTLEGT